LEQEGTFTVLGGWERVKSTIFTNSVNYLKRKKKVIEGEIMVIKCLEERDGWSFWLKSMVVGVWKFGDIIKVISP